MKRTFTLIAAITTVFQFINAQITITQNDFANAGDTVEMSTANTPQGLNYKATGIDTAWDYSFLHPKTRIVDSFYSINSTGTVYAIFFVNSSLNPQRRANIAQKGQNPAGNSLLSPISFSNVYNFYYKSSTKYIQPGFGGDINITGLNTPVAYSHPDVLYNFPIQYGDADTSVSDYNINIPTIGYFGHQQTRTNVVDGWGMLTTPFGTFPVLRVVTQLTGSDSTYLGTLSFGFRSPAQTTKQYKWIGNLQKEPLLEIDTRVTSFGSHTHESVTSIHYRDSLAREIPNGIIETTEGHNFNIYPNPAAVQFTVFNELPAPDAVITVCDVNGRIVYTDKAEGNSKNVDVAGWAKGVYFVTLTNGTNSTVHQVEIQ